MNRTDESIYAEIDRITQGARDNRVERMAAKLDALNADHPGFITEYEPASGLWLVTCKLCGSVCQYSNPDNIDYRHSCTQPVPFCGELNADDANDTAPACYGL